MAFNLGKVLGLTEVASKITYIVLMILAIIFIAIGVGLLGSWNIVSGIILLLVGGGLGYVGYTLNKTGGEEAYYGAEEDDADEW